MSDAAAAPKPKKAPAKAKKPATHPKYSEMIGAAIKALKTRGGCSRAAILKYICANYTVGNNQTLVNSRVKIALKAGVKAGTIKQAKGVGASGSFKLGEVKKPKAPKKAKKPKAAKPKKAKKAKTPKSDKPKKAKTPKKKAAAKPKKAKTPKKAAAKPKKAAKSPKKAKAAKPKKAKTPKKK